jgi:UPF0716 family protein affecting phage T7 exclusion
MIFKKTNPVIWLILIPFVEVGTTIFLTKTLGAVVTYSLFAASNIVGLIILWFDWKRVKPYCEMMAAINKLDKEEKARRTAEPEFAKQMMEVVKFCSSVVLLLIPGFVTDSIAFYLMYQFARNADNLSPPLNQADVS